MIKIYIASAFCKDNNGGNKAGVVLYQDNLSDKKKKKKIAKILGYAETAFITDFNTADFKIEYFTQLKKFLYVGMLL